MAAPVKTVIDQDTKVIGEVSGGDEIEVFGAIEGELMAERIVVHQSGSVIGLVRAQSATIAGVLEGEIAIRDLIDIEKTGAVSGKVEYGQLALAPGGRLEASIRNIPPTLTGDLNLSVERGRQVTLSTKDVSAVDPDDAATDLTFLVSNPANGWLALAGAPSQAIKSFTKADLEARRIAFVHDGAAAPDASFDIVVADREGATSGKPKSVRISVQ